MRSYKLNEDHNFTIGLRSLSTYNKLAYKHIIFNILPQLKEGNLLGDKHDDKIHVHLPCDDKFEYVHGESYMVYSVDNDTINLLSVEPSNVWLTLYKVIHETYKGVPIIKPSDKFKLDLLDLIGED